MGQFHRIAKRRIALVDTLLGGLLGQHRRIPDMAEEMGIQGEVGVDQKAAVESHPPTVAGC
jgi:hypothetical protein